MAIGHLVGGITDNLNQLIKGCIEKTEIILRRLFISKVFVTRYQSLKGVSDHSYLGKDHVLIDNLILGN